MNRSRAVIAMALLLLATAAAGQERPGRLDRELRNALQPGLKVEFRSPGGGSADARTARMAALYVPASASPTPFHSAGAFSATFSGYLKTQLRGEQAFSFVGRGAVALHVNGQQVQRIAQGDLARAEPVVVELAKGHNHLRIDYESPASGAAQMRMLWSGADFPAEPVSPETLFHDGRDAAWRAGVELRRGRLLLAQHRCLNCHPAKPRLMQAEHRMFEIGRDAPSLADAGSRLHADWLVEWIIAPDRMRNKTTMPRLLPALDEKSAQRVARDIAAYLATLKKGVTSTERQAAHATDEVDKLVDQGEVLFENLGCIACHRFTSPAAEDEFDRVSLHYISRKFVPGSLREFLADSRKHFAFSRMPQFDLTAAECRALAAYLRKRLADVDVEVQDLDAADAQRGKRKFVEVGCANCHAVSNDSKPVPAADRIQAPIWQAAALDKGCLSEDEANRGQAPRFDFEEPSRAALRALLETDLSSLARSVPVEFSMRQWESMSCRACHARDNEDPNLPYILLDEGEQGKPAEPVPNLTWAGDKLLPGWIPQRMTGKLGYTPRPHFNIRMPALPHRGQLFAQGLCHEHGFGNQPDKRPLLDDKLAETGAGVAAMQTGLACHRCHAIGDRQATAPFEARSTNLSYATERLRYDFFHRWMRDPLRIDPNTKMLKFSPDGNRTGLTQFYEGDAQRQFEAVWHYLEKLNQVERQEPTGK